MTNNEQTSPSLKIGDMMDYEFTRQIVGVINSEYGYIRFVLTDTTPIYWDPEWDTHDTLSILIPSSSSIFNKSQTNKLVKLIKNNITNFVKPSLQIQGECMYKIGNVTPPPHSDIEKITTTTNVDIKIVSDTWDFKFITTNYEFGSKTPIFSCRSKMTSDSDEVIHEFEHDFDNHYEVESFNWGIKLSDEQKTEFIDQIKKRIINHRNGWL